MNFIPSYATKQFAGFTQRNTVALSALFLSLLCTSAQGATLQAGPGKPFSSPCQAIAASADGDTVEIDGASYEADTCVSTKDRLTFRGVNGRPVLNAAGKGTIWTLRGDNNVIDNIEFTGASSKQDKAAAVALFGQSLTVRNSYFHHNDNGLLEFGGDRASRILIERSEFASNGSEDGEAHSISIAQTGSLTLRFNYLHDAIGGNLIRSFAADNDISYNRMQSQQGAASAELDLPAGGNARIDGNIFHKSAGSQSPNFVVFGGEGTLSAANNTLVSEYPSDSTFVAAENAQARLTLINNLMAGSGRFTNAQNTDLRNNLVTEDAKFADADRYDYRLSQDSPAVNAGIASVEVPAYQVDGQKRPSEGKLDLGALEYVRTSEQVDGNVVETANSRVNAKGGRSIVGDPQLSELRINPAQVAGVMWTTNNYVVLDAPALAGGSLVTLTSSNRVAVSVPPSVMVPAGSTTAQFLMRTTAVVAPVSVVITGTYKGVAKTCTVTASPIQLTSVTLMSARIGGGATVYSNKVQLNGPSIQGGTTVALASSSSAVTVPATVMVGTGVNAGFFTLTSSIVPVTTNVTITATHNGITTNAMITIEPVSLSSVASLPATVASGVTNNVRVRLSGPALAGGAPTVLTSSHPSLATFRSSSTVLEGRLEVFVQTSIGYVPVPTAITFTASYLGTSTTGILNVNPTVLYSIYLSPSSIKGGLPTTGSSVRLNGPAPAGGITVLITNSNPALVTTPVSVTIPAGQTFVTLPVTTQAVAVNTPVVITATWNGVAKTGTLTLKP